VTRVLKWIASTASALILLAGLVWLESPAAPAFAAVRAAYERLKDLDARVRHRLFEQGKRDGIDELIEDMACRTPRRRFGLQALLQMLQRPR